MSQTIGIHVGGFGTKAGLEYWKTLEREYAVFEKEGIDKSNDFYEGLFGSCLPRAVVVNAGCGVHGRDFEDTFPLDKFSVDSCLVYQDYHGIETLINPILDAIDMQAEQCDYLHGFNITAAMDGRLSYSFFSRVLGEILYRYPGKIIQVHSLEPESAVSINGEIAKFRTLLSLDNIENWATAMVTFSNSGLNKWFKDQMRTNKPTSKNHNQVIGHYLAGITSPFRFPGLNNTSPRKVLTSLMPFYGTKYLMPMMSPLYSDLGEIYRDKEIKNVARYTIGPDGGLASAKLTEGRYLTYYANFRGQIEMSTAEESLSKIRVKNESYHFPTMNNNFGIGMSPFSGLKFGTSQVNDFPSLYVLALHSEATKWINQLHDSLRPAIARKGFYYHLSEDGIEESEILQACDSLKTIIENQNFDVLDKSLDEEHNDNSSVES